MVASGTLHKATKILPCSDTMAQQDAQIEANRILIYRKSHTHLHINSLPVKLSDETRQGKGGGLCKANQTLAPAALCISSTSTPRPAFTIIIIIIIIVIITIIAIIAIIIIEDTYGGVILNWKCYRAYKNKTLDKLKMSPFSGRMEK